VPCGRLSLTFGKIDPTSSEMKGRRLPEVKSRPQAPKRAKKSPQRSPGAARMAKHRQMRSAAGTNDLETAICTANRYEQAQLIYPDQPRICKNFTRISDVPRWWWAVFKRCSSRAAVELPFALKGTPRKPFHGRITNIVRRRSKATDRYWILVASDNPVAKVRVVAASPEHVFANFNTIRKPRSAESRSESTWACANRVDQRVQSMAEPPLDLLVTRDQQERWLRWSSRRRPGQARAGPGLKG
jgi:hypothetical protein